VSRAVLYVAHCLRPSEEDIAAHRRNVDESPEADALDANIHRAMRWLAWLRRSFPETTFIAPWIANILAYGDDAYIAAFERGGADACAVIERCDGIVLCGGRISDGMRKEMEHGAQSARGPGREVFAVYDMTGDRAYMPSDVNLRTDQTWAEWAKALRI